MKWWDILWRLGESAVWTWAQRLDYWRWQMLQSLLLIVLAGVCGLGVLLLSSALVLLAYWESYRFQALWGLLLVYAAMALYLVRRATRLASWRGRPSMRRAADDSGDGRSPSSPGAGRGR
jgi:membrane protein implicated in regulation of membrane protease activity